MVRYAVSEKFSKILCDLFAAPPSANVLQLRRRRQVLELQRESGIPISGTSFRSSGKRGTGATKKTAGGRGRLSTSDGSRQYVRPTPDASPDKDAGDCQPQMVLDNMSDLLTDRVRWTINLRWFTKTSTPFTGPVRGTPDLGPSPCRPVNLRWF